MTDKPPLILLVEDEAAHAALIQRAFENEPEPVSLVIATNLQAARGYLASLTPDLLIIDFLLPDGRGTELLPADREQGDYPVVILTSHGDEETAVLAMKGGALDYVVKSDMTLITIPRFAKRALREWGYITDRKRAEKEIRLLSTAVEQTAESILITDVNDTIVYVNPAFEQTTGYRRAEILGKTPALLKSNQQDTAFYSDLWTTISQGNVWHGRLINRKKDGSFYTAETTITPVRDEHGNIVNYVSAQHDVTNELKLEERLRQIQKMEAVGQLAGGVAHDFNNILQAILGYAHLVKSALVADNPGQADLDQIVKATGRATALVRQLLAFSRREPLQPCSLDLHEVIKNLLKMLQRLTGEHINLELQAQSNLKAVQADTGQIEQILINLCVNARDAMPEGGKITINLENYYFNSDQAKTYPWAREGDYVRLSVSDTGTGIPPELQEHIFEPFFTTKEIGQGTGLGLATVYAITEQHHGGINVYSEPGHGTTFQVYFPAIAGRPALSRNERPERLGIINGTKTVLVAEDDDMLRQQVTTILEKAGYGVLPAPDGEEAIRLFEQYRDSIDLALLDAVMPKKSGQAVYDCIRTHQSLIPVLFSTGYSYEVSKNTHPPEDRVHLIRKPYSPHDLLQQIRQILDTRIEHSREKLI